MLAGHIVLPLNEVHSNPHSTSTYPNKGGNLGTDAFYIPLLGYIMIGNEHDMLTKFLKLKTLVFWVLKLNMLMNLS